MDKNTLRQVFSESFRIRDHNRRDAGGRERQVHSRYVLARMSPPLFLSQNVNDENELNLGPVVQNVTMRKQV